MILIVFLNEYDKRSHLLGRELPDYLKGNYVKLYTRYDSDKYESCKVINTLDKLREYAKVFDKIIVSFGLRLFPPSSYKNIVREYKKTNNNMVFLKKLRGSKTWTIDKEKLQFDNSRIADTGLFILLAKDLLESKAKNFNTFLHELVKKEKMTYKFVSYWLFTNKNYNKNSRKREVKK